MEKEQPTLLLDEAQSLVRLGSESSEMIRELLNSGIDRNAKIIRCGGKNMNELQTFRLYSPKVVALIGELDGVLADRSLVIRLERKTDTEDVQPVRYRVLEQMGRAVAEKIDAWCQENREQVAGAYDTLDLFKIPNDRIAELLAALQAVVSLLDPDRLSLLQQYAEALVSEDAEAERASPAVKLLLACREILTDEFMPTLTLLEKLNERQQHDPQDFGGRTEINAERLSRLLRTFNIRPQAKTGKVAGKVFCVRGYLRDDFTEAWGRYLPPACS